VSRHLCSVISRLGHAAILLVLGGCSALELPDPGLPRQPASLPYLTSVLVGDSLLETTATIDLGPALAAAEQALGEVVAAAVEKSAAPAAGTGKGNGAKTRPAKGGAAKAVRNGAPEGNAARTAKAGERPSDAQGHWPKLLDGARFYWKVQSATPRALLRNDTLDVEIELTYGVATAVRHAGWTKREIKSCGCDGEAWCGGRKDPHRRALLRWTVPLSVSKDLRLTGEPTFALEAPGDCRLPQGRSEPPVDAKGKVLEFVPKLIEKPSLDALGKSLTSFKGIRQAIEPLWSGLHAPLPAAKEHGPWLLLRPRALDMGPLKIQEARATSELTIAVNPLIVPWKPDKAPAVHWPPPSGTGEAKGFHVIGQLDTKLDAARSALASTFVGRRFPKRQDHYVEITGVDLYRSPGVAVVDLAVDGAARGSLAFVGELRVEPSAEIVSIHDLAPSESTEKGIAALYDEMERVDLRVRRVPWIDREQLTREVAQASQWSYGAERRALRRSAELAARSAVLSAYNLGLTLSEYAPINVSLSEDAIQIQVVMAGRATLEPIAESASRVDAEPPPGSASAQ
jgi:hypothetical protein